MTINPFGIVAALAIIGFIWSLSRDVRALHRCMERDLRALWYSAHPSPASTSNFVTVLMDTRAMRLVARMKLPSTSMWRMRARSSVLSLFMVQA